MDVRVSQGLDATRVEEIEAAYAREGIRRPAGHFARCLREIETGQRIALIASADGAFAGHLYVLFSSHYKPFRARKIPELSDLLVLGPLRRQGLGGVLLDTAERLLARDYPLVGLGVGLYRDYAPAQRIYARRGYVPDGRGLVWRGAQVVPGSDVRVDDDLLLYLTKDLRAAGSD